MIITVDREYVSFTEHNNVVAGRALSYCISRGEFANRFGITIPPEIYAASYEPERSLYHVVTGWDNVITLASPSDHPLMLALHNARDTIKTAAESAYLEALAASSAAEAAMTEKRARIAAELPSWTTVETAVNNISNLDDAKVFMMKLAKVVYWLAKNSYT